MNSEINETGIFSKAYLHIENFFTKLANWVRGKRSVKKEELEKLASEINIKLSKIAQSINDAGKESDKKISDSQRAVCEVVERHYQQLTLNQEKINEHYRNKLESLNKTASELEKKIAGIEKSLDEIRQNPWGLFNVGSYKEVYESVIEKFRAAYQKEIEKRIKEVVAKATQSIDDKVKDNVGLIISKIMEDSLVRVNSLIKEESEQAVKAAVEKEIEIRYSQGIFKKPLSKTWKMIIGAGLTAAVLGAGYVGYWYAKKSFNRDYTKPAEKSIMTEK